MKSYCVNCISGKKDGYCTIEKNFNDSVASLRFRHVTRINILINGTGKWCPGAYTSLSNSNHQRIRKSVRGD